MSAKSVEKRSSSDLESNEDKDIIGVISQAPPTYAPGEQKQIGVLSAEAARGIAGWSLWVGILGIAMVAYCYGLDNSTFYAWQTYATTEFNDYAAYTSISIVQAVIIAVAKLPIAKLADVFGRAQAYTVSLIFYIIGFIVIAVSQSTRDVAGATVLYATGNTGIQIMQQIVIADFISTKWRGAAIGLVSLPYVLNFYVGPRIVSALQSNWRWGPGFFTIILPVAACPIIMVLALNQRSAKKKGLVPPHPYSEFKPEPARSWREVFSLGFLIRWYKYIVRASRLFFVDIDAVVLFLFCAGWLMFLLPLNLAKLQKDGWQTGWIIAMLVLGGVCIIGAVIWELLVSEKPILRKRWALNKDVQFATWIGFFDFFSFYTSWVPAYTWVMICHDYSLANAGYYSNTQSLGLTVFGIMAGFVSLATKRYKWQMVVGSVIRMLGIGLMIKYREIGSSTFQIVMPQVLQGLGGGILGITLQVAAQVSVLHQDVALVTAYLLLITEIGGACGNAVVGAVQTNVFPEYLAKYLPDVDAATRATIAASPYGAALTYPMGSPIREGLILAYNDYVHKLLIISISLSVVPIILTLLIKDRKLNDKQNCVSDELAGMKFSPRSDDVTATATTEEPARKE
ncbi:putative siderophore iron transporter mirC [Violaceomyces palustris]|uniref:Siderophore iron transporter mirC n=1 Tax=Violaceomyces palustris TaxID=1673888 RepID=A0ACD0NR58_9BASI|nr:putative siderophore iron transporter mirC [Violaceomyces palustris]